MLEEFKKRLGQVKQSVEPLLSVVKEQGMSWSPVLPNPKEPSATEQADVLLRRPGASQESFSPSFADAKKQKGVTAEKPPLTEEWQAVQDRAYTHGLEAIYALENVDISSVRRLSQEEHAPSADKNRIASTQPLSLSRVPPSVQLYFDLGVGFRREIRPLVLSEPIQVLRLAPQAERCLLENGRTTLQDVLELDLASLAFQGMGQGHIDEMEQKISHYLMERAKRPCRKVDFRCFLSCLLATQARLSAFVFLEPYGLETLFPLSAGDGMTLRRMNLSKRMDLKEELLQRLREPAKRHFIATKLEEIAEVLVRPWIEQRKGLATWEEVEERLESISVVPHYTRKVLNFLGQVYYGGKMPFHEALIALDDNAVTARSDTAAEFHKVIQTAHSYYYLPTLHYPLSTLVSLVEREEARNWQGFPEGFVEKAIRLASSFHCRRDTTGISCVWKSIPL